MIPTQACAWRRRSRIARQSTSDPLETWTREDAAHPSARSHCGASDKDETARNLPRTRTRDVLLASFCAERSCTPVGSDVVNARTRCGTQNAMCTHVWDRLKARWCQGGNPESGAVCAVALVFIQSPTTRSLTGLSLINSRDKTQLVSHAWLHVDPPRFSPRRPPSVLITRKLRRTQRKLAVSITLPQAYLGPASEDPERQEDVLCFACTSPAPAQRLTTLTLTGSSSPEGRRSLMEKTPTCVEAA